MLLNQTRLAGLTMALLLGLAPAADAQPQGGPGGRRGPSAEAFAACIGLAVGTACTVTFGEHRIQGTCAQFFDQRILCRPQGMPPRHPDGQGPPGPPSN